MRLVRIELGSHGRVAENDKQLVDSPRKPVLGCQKGLSVRNAFAYPIVALLGLIAPNALNADELSDSSIESESSTDFEGISFDDAGNFDSDDYCGECYGVNGHNIKHGRVDVHAPAHLFGDHVHKQGEWMFEYKYMNMFMDGNRSGTTQLSDNEALDFIGTVPPNTPGVSAYAASPTDMTMQMHMMHIMHGVTDDLTLFIMPMWTVNSMDHIRRPGTPPFTNFGPEFSVTNAGFGDLAFGGLWRVYEGESDEVILNIGFTAPTGDIDDVTSVPTGSPGEYPYPMRLGSGTWDAKPGITYRSYWENWSIGLQFQTDLPLGLNDSRYRMGNEYRANAWVARVLNCEKTLAATFRVEGLWKSNYVGADPDLNPNLISTADPDMRGGESLNFGYGLMYKLPCRNTINFEIAHRVHQRLRGVQLENDWSLAASWSKVF